MEKNRLLVPHYKTLALIVFAGLFVSCSIPRIIVLHDPLTPEEHINLGVSYEQNGEYDAALKEYDAASKKLPIAYLYMANIHFQQGTTDKAERLYTRAIEKTGDARAYNNLAWLCYTTGRNLDKAEELGRKAVELAPDSPDFRDTLDRILEKRGLETDRE
ncbi:MAG: Photosystem I assembly protein Ycf3 [Syntrophorhabdus sp. PtaU1.Bin153]|nr:MAG: Photosystem I assembly protein Ycf3 [Syntrophorhabdus sp. PtaU1.Bin153]